MTNPENPLTQVDLICYLFFNSFYCSVGNALSQEDSHQHEGTLIKVARQRPPGNFFLGRLKCFVSLSILRLFLSHVEWIKSRGYGFVFLFCCLFGDELLMPSGMNLKSPVSQKQLVIPFYSKCLGEIITRLSLYCPRGIWIFQHVLYCM